eukprot:SAG11_NODE_2265_length_3604_cov_1.956646_1_plen_74_part_00
MEDFWPPFIFQNKIILFNNFLFELKRFNTIIRSLHDLVLLTYCNRPPARRLTMALCKSDTSTKLLELNRLLLA